MEGEFDIMYPLPGVSLQAFVVIMVAVIAIVGVVFEIVRVKLRQRWHRRRGPRPELQMLRKLSSELEIRGLENVKIPGRRRLPRIDHVMRLPASIVVLVFGPRDAHGELQLRERGLVWGWREFGRDHMQLDPTQKMKTLAKALQQAHPFIKIRSLYILPTTLTLPDKGVPPTVIRADTIPDALRAAIAEDKAGPKGNDDLLDKAWNDLLKTAQAHMLPRTARQIARSPQQPVRN